MTSVAERVLWGWVDGGTVFRAALPVIEGFPVMKRDRVKVKAGLPDFPPYLSASYFWPDGPKGPPTNVRIWRGDGYAACAGGVHPNELDDEDMSRYILADGSNDNIPDEWKEPIAAALAEVRERYPDAQLRFTP